MAAGVAKETLKSLVKTITFKYGQTLQYMTRVC